MDPEIEETNFNLNKFSAMPNGIQKSDVHSAGYDISSIVLMGMFADSRLPLRYELNASWDTSVG